MCAYCDFVTVAGRRTDIPRYVDALLLEMASRPSPGELRTISFGGGTPSRLSAAQVERLVVAALDRWASAVPLEVSLEANPSRREAPDWKGIRSAGVTRISLGVQALRDEELQVLGRGHRAADAIGAYRSARAAGFDSIGFDMIYGIAGQSVEDWRAGLLAAVALAPDHLSLYALTLATEPDEWSAPPRRGALRWRQRMLRRQNDDIAAAQYELAEEMLAAAGYGHYELSSWARPGHESVHNRAYWERRPYTGLGIGAHSFDGRVRSWNQRDLDRYLALVESGASPRVGQETLDERVSAFEAVALGLRLVDGLSRAAFRSRFGQDPADRFAAAVRSTERLGLLEVDAGVIRLTRSGRLLANEALVAFVGSD